MGRHTETGAHARAGTGSAGRLDPSALPVCFAAPDTAADGGIRHVTLDAARVVVDRTIQGMAMRIVAPLSTFSGVALRVQPGKHPSADRVEVLLAHRDRAFDVPLHVSPADGDGLAVWRDWSRALKLPLLVEELDGRRSTPAEMLGLVEVARPRARRGRGFLKGRRTRFQTKRRTGKLTAETKVARGEREIIARN